MDFFYQAIKRATGVAEPASVEVLSPETHVKVETVAEAKADKVAIPHSAAAAMAEPPRKSVSTRKSFDVPHPLEGMVAFLSHPVLEPNIAAMEQCRILRTRLREIMNTKKIRTVLLTSAMPSEGKTLLSVNLAYALSQVEGMKVLLVDSDLRRPAVASFLKMRSFDGLNKYLLEQAEFDDVALKLTPSLDVVPTRELREDAAELLHGSRMQQFLAEASTRYNVVLLDGPPMFPIVDAQVLAHLVDGVVLVIRAHNTPFDFARQAADMLKPKLIGTILNGVDRLPNNHYYEGYIGVQKKK